MTRNAPQRTAATWAGVSFGVYRFTTTGGEISESYAELLERLESTKRTLRNAMEFINDDRHLTDEGIAAREALLEEIETIEQNLEAIRQEHGLE